MLSKELLASVTRRLVDSGASARTTGLLVGILSPSFVRENYTVPRQNIGDFISFASSKVDIGDLPILDLGCGRRNHKKIFAQSLDLKEDLIPYAAIDHFKGDDPLYRESGPNVLGDVSTVPLKSGSVGCVICTEVLEHVPDEMEVISEITRVLRSGGKLFLSVPGKYIPNHEKLPFQRDYRRFGVSDLYFKLSEAGFGQIMISDKHLYGMQINIFAEAVKI